MLIKRLTLKKVLSFNDSTIELGKLNVLIGPNAVGKSNLIEIISLLQAAPTSIAAAILRGGGVRQWIWLGDLVPSPIATIKCELFLSAGRQIGPVVYELQFSEGVNGFVILNEQIAKPVPSSSPTEAYLIRSSHNAKFGPAAPDLERDTPNGMTVRPTESILSQFKSPFDATPITEIGDHFAQTRIFREFRTGPQSAAE
jgi:predicted ATPase